MYTTEVTGHYRFVQNGQPPPCACQRCVRFDLGHGNHDGGAQTSRQTDHPAFWDQTRRDRPAESWAKDPACRTSFRLERGCHRSPQRRPVFVGTVPCNHTSPVRSYEVAPVHCNCNARHCPPLREQCGCSMVRSSDTRVFSFAPMPQPLPHLQVKGQKGYTKPCRTVRYASMEDEDYISDRGSSEPQFSPQMGYQPNGHGGMRNFGALEGVEDRDTHQDWSRGGSEHGCNGHGGFYKGFFSTEVPSKHFNPARRKNGPYISSSSGTQGLKLNGGTVRTGQSPEPGDSKRRDTVREQIRQVVTNLEDVLGGLKQVHVEMKEVVEQIDRLTASIDLEETPAGLTYGADNFNSNNLDYPEDLRPVSLGNHGPQHVDEDRIILRTNSPSAVHTASVVKTNRIVPPKQNGVKNGHPPQLFNANRTTGHTQELPPPHHPPPQALDPKVIIESRTQKPPPYPLNGRCGGKYPISLLVKPARAGRGRQSSSVV